MRSRGTLAVPFIVLGVLTACTAPSPTPSPTTVSTPQPSASSSTPPQAAPGDVRIGLDCAQLAGTPEASTVLGGSAVVLSAVDEWPYGAIASYSMARRAAIHRLGGVDCALRGAADDAYELTVRMLPLDSPWTATGEPIPGSGIWSEEALGGCDDGVGGRWCDYDIRVNGVWIEIRAVVSSPGSLEDLRGGAESLSQALARRVAALPAPGAAWHGGDPAAPSDCAAWGLEGTSIGFGELRPGPTSPSAGVIDAALTETRSLDCTWVGSEPGMLSVLVLPAGETSWDAAPPLSNGSLVLEPAAGLGTRALAGCTAIEGSATQCMVHAVEGDTWVVVEVTAADRAAAVEIARGLLARL